MHSEVTVDTVPLYSGYRVPTAPQIVLSQIGVNAYSSTLLVLFAGRPSEMSLIREQVLCLSVCVC